MEIVKKEEGTTTVLKIAGRLDTVTAPDLATEIAQINQNCKEIVLDCENLEYVSSAGLRVILSTHEKMEAEGGKLVIKHANDMIQSIFALTGFIEILHIEA